MSRTSKHKSGTGRASRDTTPDGVLVVRKLVRLVEFCQRLGEGVGCVPVRDWLQGLGGVACGSAKRVEARPAHEQANASVAVESSAAFSRIYVGRWTRRGVGEGQLFHRRRCCWPSCLPSHFQAQPTSLCSLSSLLGLSRGAEISRRDKATAALRR